MSTEAKQERREWGRGCIKSREASMPPLENAGLAGDMVNEERSEFDRFEDLARQLVQTRKPPK
jgi:hypothetical protein